MIKFIIVNKSANFYCKHLPVYFLYFFKQVVKIKVGLLQPGSEFFNSSIYNLLVRFRGPRCKAPSSPPVARALSVQEAKNGCSSNDRHKYNNV